MPVNFIYNRLLLPAADAVFHVAGLFNEKARASVKGRSHWAAKLEKQLEDAPPGPRLLLHAPSVGEFLQGRAVLDRMLEINPRIVPVVTHFSPSAEKIVGAYDKAAAHGYLPLDTPRNNRALLDLVKPGLIVFSRADVWPNLAAEAAARNIPTALIAAMLSEPPRKINQAAVKFAARRFKSLSFIAAVSEEDAARFRELGIPQESVAVTGDPRYDQTWERARAVDPGDAIFNQFPKKSWLFIAGSTWPQDEKAVIPAFAQLKKKYADAKMIVVPHEPSPVRVQSIRSSLAAHGLSHATLSELESSLREADAIVVDRVGILGKLYLIGKIAFVGGSFVRRVHNVMEPACFGLPVIVGPKHKNSHEALAIIKTGGCFVADNEQALAAALLRFAEDDKARTEAGAKAMKLVESQRGAAMRTAEAIRTRFPGLFPQKADS